MLIQLGESPFSVSFQSIKKLKTEETITRRELFSHWKRKSKAVVKEAMPAKWRFNQEDLDLSKYYRNYQFATLSVNTEVCTLCNACQKLCAKNCFDIQEETFLISTQTRSSCQLCVDICPEKALMIEERISSIERLSYSVYKKTCTECHSEFKTLRELDDICLVCLRKQSTSSFI